MDWIHLTQERAQWRALANVAINTITVMKYGSLSMS
jgi:hypothetical protein